MKLARVLPLFSIVFIVAYAVALEYNLALFTYYPTVNKFHWAVQSDLPGPPMFFYGWLATAAICAAIVSGIAALLPLRIERWWPGLPWLAALGAMAFVAYINRVWFIH
jgi:hypothetical protein